MEGLITNESLNKVLEEINIEDLINQITLTSLKVWDTVISREDIENWIENFKGEVFDEDVEKNLAIILLSNFVYYNHDEIKHLCKTLYRKFVHHSLSIDPSLSQGDDNPILNLQKKTRFYHLGKPGESSAFILYFFRQVNQLPIKRFISKFKDLSDDVENIVFIDDVALSYGDKDSGESKNQAFKYISKILGDEKKLKEKKLILLSFISTIDAIEYLESKGVLNISTIQLYDNDKCFDSKSKVFHELEELIEPCMLLAKHYGSKLEPHHPLGYNDCQFLFGFFYNTPDNTLPIFWSKNEEWNPIFKRHKKIYDNKKIEQLGKFI